MDCLTVMVPVLAMLLAGLAAVAVLAVIQVVVAAVAGTLVVLEDHIVVIVGQTDVQVVVAAGLLTRVRIRQIQKGPVLEMAR